ncbi:MAG TPA: alpha/beta hydrolase [Acidimicrobiales bacterium]|nr:alpha/beta hydrolase [Acidimicrobiales bacterium]
MGHVDYDEFGLFHENAQEYGLPYDAPPIVRRSFVEVAPGRNLSALVWQGGEPELVFLHGGAQNAHTWDTVAMALDRPLVAVDLPGHGHSDGAGDRPGVAGNAVDVAIVVCELAPTARAVIGVSLGGLVTIALAKEAPELVRNVVLVDVLPGIKGPRSKHITDFLSGPSTFSSLEELIDRTASFNPTRSRSSLRRGILHNAEQQDDGSWRWRWARHRDAASGLGSDEQGASLFDELWASVSSIAVPLLLARGMQPDSVLGDEDEEELLRRLPSAQVVHFEHGGHSLQGDTPLELAALIENFVFDSYVGPGEG